MKKSYFFLLAMLIGLSGCLCKKDKKAKKPKTKKKVEVMDQVNIPVSGDEISSYFDDTNINLGEFVLVEDEEVETSSDVANAASETSSESYLDSEVVLNIDEEKEISLDDFSWVQEIENEEQKLQSVHFKFDRFDIAEDQQATVDTDIEITKNILKDGGDPTVVIEGNSCSSAGSELYNLVLSEKRAKVVADRFVAAGIDRDNIKVVARGISNPKLNEDGEPISGNKDEQWMNRRTDFRIIYN